MLARPILRHAALLAVALASCTAAPAAAQQPVDTTTFVIEDEVIGMLDSRLFGQFLERPSWTGETGPEMAYDQNTGTLAAGVIDAMESMNIPVIRWPGGTDVDYMNWTDMITNAPDREDPARPVSTGHTGEEVENSFGMDEALTLIEGLGAEALLVVNVRDALLEFRTVEEAALHAAGLIAYANAEVGADLPEGMPDYPAIRAQNGREEPWDARYVQIGNETWLLGRHDDGIVLPSQGDIDPEVKAFYYEILRAYIDAIKAVDPDIEIIVDGHTDDTTDELRGEFGDDIDYLAFHHYYPWSSTSISIDGEEIEDPQSFMRDPANRELIWQAWVAPRVIEEDGTARLRYRDFDNIVDTGYPMAITEWNFNTWIGIDGDSGGFYDPLGARGLGAMTQLHEMMKRGSHIALATQSMLVGERWFISAIRHVPSADITFRLPSGVGSAFYSNHHGNEVVAFSHDGLPLYDQPIGMGAISPKTGVSFLEPVVTRSADSLYVHLLNRRFESADTSLVHLDLSAYGDIATTATQYTMHILTTFGATGGSNPFESAWVTAQEVPVENGVISARIAPHSATIVAVGRERSVSVQEPEAAGRLRVGDVFPNPSLGYATLELSLPEASRVSVRIFDVLGREVATVPAAIYAAGAAHQIALPTASLAPGLYVARIATGGTAAPVSRTFTLVR